MSEANQCGGKDARSPRIGDNAVESLKRDFGTGKAPIGFAPPNKAKLSKWYRLRLKLDGPKATATLTEPQDSNPQVIEAALEGSPRGPVGIANFGTPETFANFFVRE